MHKIVFLILIGILPELGFTQSTQPDMTVFGLKLGEPLPIAECKCDAGKGKRSDITVQVKKKWFHYVNDSLISNDCFERRYVINYTVNSDEDLPIVTDGALAVVFDHKNIPKVVMAAGAKTITVIIKDSKVTTVMFDILGSASDEIFEELKNKYGNNVSVKNYKQQNGLGGTFSNVKATWTFTNLTILLESSLNRIYGDGIGKLTIMTPDKSKKIEPGRGL